MPSTRRLKIFAFLIVLFVLLTLYITASARQTRSSAFYARTQDAIEAARAATEAKLHRVEVATGEDGMVGERLRKAEEEAKKNADRKGDEFHGEEGKQKALKAKEGVVRGKDGEDKKEKEESREKVMRPGSGEKGVAGRKIMKDGKEAVLKKEEEEEEHKEKSSGGPKQETEDEKKAHRELSDILKKSPVIIFSKSYCPYSRRAKHILLEKYSISPRPYVVELDTHPLGPQLQSYLAELTGRRTVPNILINARSIGGGDDVQELDVSGTLIETVKSMGGKRMEVHLVVEGEGKAEVGKADGRRRKKLRTRGK